VKFIEEIGRGFFSGAKKKAFVWRFMYDVLYTAENIPRIAHWLADGGLADYLRIEVLRKKDIGKALLSRVRRLAKRFTTSLERPKAVEKLINDIEATRFGKKKDLYIVTGQLNSKTNEPIDSWTFFRYLQDNGIPSRYVIWRKHYLLKKIKKQGLMKDVIVLRGNGVKNFEFLNKCKKELVRARAVIQENGGIESFTGQWLRELPGCDYVFLQHGVFHLWLSNEVAEWLARSFNYINVSSERECDFLSSGFSLVPKESRADFIIGGLPRWDLLKDTSNKESEKIVFVMMTWRSTFNGGMDILKKSAYYRGLKSLLAKENLVEMKKMGLRVVWAPHHHMANRIKALDFEFDDLLEVVDTTEISKWIAKSSICITDFSSVSGDFLFLGKPVVYWVPDRDDPLLDPMDGNSGAKVKSACENLEKWFNVAGSEVEVMEYIRHYKENGFKLEEEKMRIANTLFDCKDGICERLFNGLKNDYRNFS
jgi:CDP-glycerol glycerophosphotransferase (TagB/SpsB family)